MPLSTFLLSPILVSAAPWVLVSHRLLRHCHHETCQPLARQRQPQVLVVQTCATPEECLKVREQCMQRVDEAEAPVNQLVQARTPTWYLRMTTTFVCEPEEGMRSTSATTGEQVR